MKFTWGRKNETPLDQDVQPPKPLTPNQDAWGGVTGGIERNIPNPEPKIANPFEAQMGKATPEYDDPESQAVRKTEMQHRVDEAQMEKAREMIEKAQTGSEEEKTAQESENGA